MLQWFKRKFTPSPGQAQAKMAPAVAPSTITVDSPTSDVRAWYRALETRGLAGAQTQLDAWYAAHPYEVAWKPGTRAVVVKDPLPLTSDDLMNSDPEARCFVVGAPMARTLAFVHGGTSFHNGCLCSEVTWALADQLSPSRIELMSLYLTVDYYKESERDTMVASLCTAPSLSSLKHLALPCATLVTARHFQQLMAAPWAATLQTADFTELMYNWSDEERTAVMRSLGKLKAITHLNMYNNLDDAAFIAFLEHAPASLTHLELGHMGNTNDNATWIEALANALPSLHLTHLSFGGGPKFDHPAWSRLAANVGNVVICGGPEILRR